MCDGDVASEIHCLRVFTRVAMPESFITSSAVRSTGMSLTVMLSSRSACVSARQGRVKRSASVDVAVASGESSTLVHEATSSIAGQFAMELVFSQSVSCGS